MMGFKVDPDRIGKGYQNCLSEQWWDLKELDRFGHIKKYNVLANNDGI